ncbi:MAG: Tim44/TimA family putative adaptor protein [Pseudomonadota bacterium]|nr:Tim44/TimA family putative adaptor protein [Pseudomonadota bacterium]
MFYVIVFAMIAAFLAMRLYSVLGKRTGHEQPLTRPVDDRPATLPLPRTIENAPEPREAAAQPFDSGAQAGLRAIVAAEPGFDIAQFIGGAKEAYRMVLEAFWRGDETGFADLVEPEVQAHFATAIAERTTAGHVLDNRLVSIERATIVDAELSGKEARITMRFDADIAAVTRDGEGNLVAGSMTDAVETHDVWTFARTLKSRDPNWKLADTDEA